MGDRDLKSILMSTLNQYYFSGLVDRIGRDNGSAQEEMKALGPSIERLAEELSASKSADSHFVRSIISGEANPEAVYASYRLLVGGGTATRTLLPYMPYSRVLSTDAGDIVAGTASSLQSMLKSGENGRFPLAALVTTPTSKEGLPTLGEFTRVIVRGQSVPSSVQDVPAGDLFIRCTPFSCSIVDSNGSLVRRVDLTEDYVRAVASLTGVNDYRESFSMLMGRLLDRVQDARRSISTLAARADQQRNALREGPNALVVEATLRAVQKILGPIEAQAGAAHKAFVLQSPLAPTVEGGLIGAHFRELDKTMVSVGQIIHAPKPPPDGSPSDHPLAVTYSQVAYLIGDRGLGSLLDMVRHVALTYPDSDVVRQSGIDIKISSTHPTFRSFGPHAMRALIHEIVYRAMLQNEGRQQQDIRFFFDESIALIMVTFGTPLPRSLREQLEEVANRTGFEGELSFDEGIHGVRTVIIGRPAERPEDGGGMTEIPATERGASSRRSAFSTIPASATFDEADVAHTPGQEGESGIVMQTIPCDEAVSNDPQHSTIPSAADAGAEASMFTLISGMGRR